VRKKAASANTPAHAGAQRSNLARVTSVVRQGQIECSR
jgi:hypothetical protein